MFTVCWLLAVVAGAGAGLVSASPHDQRNRWALWVMGAATSVANRCWISLQVNGMRPNGGGWRACWVAAATTKNAYASMARVSR